MRKVVIFKSEAFNDAEEIEIEPEVFVYRTKDDDAPGLLLAEYLKAQLAMKGYKMDGPLNRGDFSWDIELLDIQKRNVLFICGYTGDQEWLIDVSLRLPLWRRLIGIKTSAKQHFKKCCNSLHQILASDERVEKISWGSKNTLMSTDNADNQPPY